MDRISRIIRYKSISALLGILVLLFLAGCLGADPGKNSDAGPGGSVKVVGRVVSGSGGPLAGMPVRLARAGLVDTTDALGRYRLEGEPVVSGLTKGAATASVAEEEDTLHFEQAGQPVLSLEVSWVDSLPDVSIVQRGVAAPLLSGGMPFAKAEAVLWGGGISEATPHVVEFFHNSLVGEITGFLYFPPSPPVRNYSVFVRAVDSIGRTLGRSQTLTFNSLAGNLSLPGFLVGNALPKVSAGSDTAFQAGIGGVLALKAVNSDSSGPIAKWEWDIGGTGVFLQTSSGDTTFTVPENVGKYPCIVRITDESGNTGVDTMFVHVLRMPTWTLETGILGGTALVETDSLLYVVAGQTWSTSPNALTWTSRQPLLPRSASDIAKSDNLLVAVGNGIVASADGLTWVARDSTTTNLRSVARVGNQWVAVGGSGSTVHLLTSPDGLNWASRSDSLPENQGALFSVAGSDSLIVVTGANTIVTSPDGLNWTQRTLPQGGTVQSVAWSGTRFVATMTGFGVWLLTSVDGKVWLSRTLPFTGSPVKVIWTSGQFFLLGPSGQLWTSLDGDHWVVLDSMGATNLNDVGSLGDKIVVLRNGGVLVSL